MTRSLLASILVAAVLGGLNGGCRRDSAPSPAPPTRVDPQIVTALCERAFPLTTLDPGADLADLEKVRDHFSSSRLIALGEATHGTREFFLLKHRLVRFLVERLGFTLFILEASGLRPTVSTSM